MAHELRTPIQPIIGLSEILSLKLDNPEHHQLVEGIIRNAKRLQRITEDILDVTRIESRSLRLNKQIINLVEVIREAIEDYSDHITENRKIIFSGTDVYIDADKEKILQVVSNLLNNALKFTRQGNIEASVEVIGSMAVTRIIDEGTGIDATILPRLFTKFCTKSANVLVLGCISLKILFKRTEVRCGGKIILMELEQRSTLAFRSLVLRCVCQINNFSHSAKIKNQDNIARFLKFLKVLINYRWASYSYHLI